MKLCMGLLEKELHAEVLLRKGEPFFREFCLEGWRIGTVDSGMVSGTISRESPGKNSVENSEKAQELLLLSDRMLRESISTGTLPEQSAVLCAVESGQAAFLCPVKSEPAADHIALNSTQSASLCPVKSEPAADHIAADSAQSAPLFPVESEPAADHIVSDSAQSVSSFPAKSEPAAHHFAMNPAPAAVPRILLVVKMDFPELINAVNRIFLQFLNLEQELSRAARQARDIEQIAGLCVPALFDNLTVSTMDFHLLAHIQSETFERNLDPTSRQYLIDDRSQTEFIQYMNNDKAFYDAYHCREPFLYRCSLFPTEMLCMNVIYQGAAVCRLVYYLRQPVQDYEPELLEYIAGFIQTIYETTGGDDGNLPQNHLQYVLMKLANGETVPETLLETAMSFQRWKTGDPLICLCILPGSYNENGAAYYCKLLYDEIPDSCSFITESRIACVANLASCAGSRTAFMGKHVEFFRDNLFRAGISNLFSNPYDLHGCWLQAKIALQTGMQDRPSFWYHYFADQAMSYLKKQAVLELPARYLAAPELLALKHYDQENDTEYYHTLRLYLRNSLNALQTSRDLYIARGTMNFRLTRLEKITGLNLRDPDVRLYLEISYALLEE